MSASLGTSEGVEVKTLFAPERACPRAPRPGTPLELNGLQKLTATGAGELKMKADLRTSPGA